MSRATTALRALIVCASGCITACYSDSPLDSQPQVELDKKLLGSWRCIPPDAEGETDDTALVALAPREGAAREYAITWTDPGKEPERYRGFLSTVQGGQVLNVETDPDPKASGRWVFVRYTFLKDTKYEDPRQVFRVTDGMLHITGDGLGSIITKKEYADYHLVLEFKWGEKTWQNRTDKTKDSGLLIHSVGADGGYGGTWMPSIEVQIIEGGMGDYLMVAGNDKEGKPVPMSLTCETARDKMKRLYPS